MMSKLNYKKGFTLIELLVVVAIIGVLSSVVLASLNSARSKGSDAAIKANLSSARAQAELFYDSGSAGYEGVCAVATGAIGSMVLAAARQLSSSATVGNDSIAFVYSASGVAQGGNNSSVCHDTANGWAAIVSLKSPTAPNSGWCVDSSGNAKESTSLDSSPSLVVVCP
ncbi:MAG: type II secretion system GspH family protein [Candidatus Pacebacteria bacterium]|nr:type II secretion system GspH family protein [Candidatus Paceibacterota bacterium]MCF7862556.1 type II secretion system GspH family protein [Candidatus Paceibacterota bacterium]